MATLQLMCGRAGSDHHGSLLQQGLIYWFVISFWSGKYWGATTENGKERRPVEQSVFQDVSSFVMTVL